MLLFLSLLFSSCFCLFTVSVPEGLIHGMSVNVVPVLHVNAEAVVTLVGKQVKMMVAQPVFSSSLTKTISVFSPTTVKTHRAVTPSLKYSPATAWYTRKQLTGCVVCIVVLVLQHTPHLSSSAEYFGKQASKG